MLAMVLERGQGGDLRTKMSPNPVTLQQAEACVAFTKSQLVPPPCLLAPVLAATATHPLWAKVWGPGQQLKVPSR